MANKPTYRLQRTMLVYFMLIGVASVFLGIEYVVDTNNPELKAELIENFQKYSQSQMSIDEVFQPIEKIRNKAILMITIIMVVIIIVLSMFIKHITEPLQHMIEISRKLASGDLRQTIEIKSDNELADLGNIINDLSSNLQETTLLAKNVFAGGIYTLNNCLQKLATETLSQEDLELVRRNLSSLSRELDSLNDLIYCFHFYSSGK